MGERPDNQDAGLPEEFIQWRDASIEGAKADVDAVRFVTSWHRFPDLHDVLWYRDVNLGEVLEWALTPEVIAILAARDEKGRP